MNHEIIYIRQAYKNNEQLTYYFYCFIFHATTFHNEMKKAPGERRKHCALAVVRRSQKFSPHRRPPSRGRGKAKI